MKKCIYLLIIELCFSGLLAACSVGDFPTQDSSDPLAQYDKALAFYNQIEIGMLIDEVCALTDWKDKILIDTAATESEGGVTLTSTGYPIYTWVFGDHLGSVKYDLWQVNGPIGSKSFYWDVSNIAYRKDAISSAEEFEQVRMGMTYSEVAMVMGAPGRLQAASYTIMFGEMIMNTQVNGLPSAGWTYTLKTIDHRTYCWWENSKDPYAEDWAVIFVDGLVTEKTRR